MHDRQQDREAQWARDLETQAADLRHRRFASRRDSVTPLLVSALIDVLTLKEIAQLLGVTSQRVSALIHPSKRAEVKRRSLKRLKLTSPIDRCSRPTRHDLSNVRELVSLGFRVGEAVELATGGVYTVRRMRKFARSINDPGLGVPHKGKPVPYGQWPKSWRSIFDVIWSEVISLAIKHATVSGATSEDISQLVNSCPDPV